MDQQLKDLLTSLGSKMDEIIEWQDQVAPFLNDLKSHVESKATKRQRDDLFGKFKERENDFITQFKPKISKLLIKTGKIQDPEEFEHFVFDDLVKNAATEGFDYDNYMASLIQELTPYLDVIAEDPEVQEEVKEEIKEVVKEGAEKVEAKNPVIGDEEEIPESEPTVIKKETKDFGWGSDELPEMIEKNDDDKENKKEKFKFGW